MRIIEYRILMPLTVDEYQIGQAWSFSEVSRVNTGGGEGVIVIRNESFQLNEDKNKILSKKDNDDKKNNKTFKFDDLPEYEDYETQKLNSKKVNIQEQQSQPQLQTDKNNNNITTEKTSSGSSSSFKIRKKLIKFTSLKKDNSKQSNTSLSATASNNKDSEQANTKTSSDQLKRANTLPVKLNNKDASLVSSLNDITITTNEDLDADEGDFDNNDDGDDQFMHNNVQLNESTSLKVGQFTHKYYLIGSKLPWFIRNIIPADSMKVWEKSWNLYPWVKTVIYNEYFKNSSRVELDTIVQECSNGITPPNMHNLTKEQLSKREIVDVNIAEPVAPKDYKEDEDPTLFKSTKTGRGNLSKDWVKEYVKEKKPLIVVNKLVCVDFHVFGLQTKAESFAKNLYAQMFSLFHREIFCWIDKWVHMNMDDVRKFELEVNATLSDKLNKGEICKFDTNGD
jgi:hypothetical protein